MANEKIITLDNLATFKDKCDETYAVPDGNYPTMTVGAADSLTPYGENSGANDTTPFVMQSSGGSSDVGSKAYSRELRGNSVAFNQLNSNNYYNGGTVNGITFVKNANGSWTISGTASASVEMVISSFPIIANHKYLLKGCPNGGSTNSYWLACGQISQDDIGSGIIGYRNSDITGYIAIRVANGTAISGTLTFYPQQFDLTLMFGAGNEPTSVLEFNRLFPKPYYQYNTGTLLSCKVNGIKNVGYNAFDGELEQGRWDSDGTNRPEDTTAIRSKNFIKVVAGQKYTLDVSELGLGAISGLAIMECPTNSIGTSGSAVRLNQSGSATTFTAILSNNTQYIKFYVKYASNVSVPTNPQICFHLTWDGSRTGYEPYEKWEYALPNIELRSAGNAYDFLYSTGGGKRRIGSYTFTGQENFQDLAGSGISLTILIEGAKGSSNGSIKANIKWALGETIPMNNLNASSPEYSIGMTGDGRLYIATTKTKAQLQSALVGKTIYYELATETDITTEENPGWQNPQDIDDFGTQEFLYDSDIDIPVPQGNEFFYPVDYKAFIDSLGGREDIEYAADQVVSQEQLQTALSTFLSSISGYDATKTQTLKNVSGVFQWVDD